MVLLYLLTVAEAAKALAIRESTVRDWILRRRIAYTHVGRNVRIPQSEVDRVIQSNMVPAETHNARPGMRKH